MEIRTIANIKSLTSLRGIAALIVVVHHFAYTLFPNTGNVLSTYTGALFRQGYICVDFFFILSGFVMTHVYRHTFSDRVNSTDYWAYLRSRWARIYPLHLFALLLFVGWEFAKFSIPNTQPFTDKFNLTALFANLVLLQAFDLNCPPLFWCDTYWNEPAWSVSVEFVIYCLFPFGVYWLLNTCRRAELPIFLGALMAMLLLIRFNRGTLDSIVGVPSIARCGLECLMGAVVCQVYTRGNYRQYLNSNVLTIIAIGWNLGLMIYWNDRGRSLHDWLMLPGLTLLILGVATQTHSWISRLLWSRSLVYLGTISYSIYLVHWFIALLFRDFWKYTFAVDFNNMTLTDVQSLLAIGTFVAVTSSCAALTYRFIESPLRRYLKPPVPA